MKSENKIECRIKYLESILYEFKIGYGDNLSEKEKMAKIYDINKEIKVLKWVLEL